MYPLSLIILADRGKLKAFSVERILGATPHLQLVRQVNVAEPRQCAAEKFTDQAGAFPNGGWLGTGNSTAERMLADAEEEIRTFREIAGEIVALLRKYQPDQWGFAAPSEINGAILDGLPAEHRQTLAQNLPRDLVNVPPNHLSLHFERNSNYAARR
jgi:hypothetical protein